LGLLVDAVVLLRNLALLQADSQTNLLERLLPKQSVLDFGI